MTTTEQKIKRELKEVILHAGATYVQVQQGAGTKTGDPDLVMCYNGCFVGIEAKTYYGVQSEWQKLRQREIQEAGGIYLIAHEP